MQYTINDILINLQKLPTINTVAFEVIQLCSDKEIPIPKLVKVISMDQSLSSQILKVANSSYYNFPRTIYSLDRAIVILGFNLLRDIAVSLSVFSFFRGLDKTGQLDYRKLWEHSLYTAISSKFLADSYDPDSKDRLYLAGLLHDIGKLAMVQGLQKDYIFLTEKGDRENANLCFLEKKFLGFTHAEVGAKLLEIWNFPEDIVTLVNYHHTPDAYNGTDNLASLIRLTYLGNMLAKLLDQPEQNINTLAAMDPNFMTFFSFTDVEIEQMIELVKKYLEDNKEFVKIFQTGRA